MSSTMTPSWQNVFDACHERERNRDDYDCPAPLNETGPIAAEDFKQDDWLLVLVALRDRAKELRRLSEQVMPETYSLFGDLQVDANRCDELAAAIRGEAWL